MNKLPIPQFDDSAALKILAENHLLGSYPHLSTDLKKITKGYQNYIAAQGDANLIKKIKIKSGNSKYLIGHYKSPPVAISIIDKLRSENEHRTCPMCGSLHRNSLDHILPKEDFGEFAIFTKNLVPACKCNSLRKNKLLGLNPGERVLHPYFDKCLGKRLLSAKFSDLGKVPSILISISVSRADPDYSAINFHLQEIVAPMPILGYIGECWANFVRQPSLMVRDLKANPASAIHLRQILLEERRHLDDVHKSKNNWNSIFISGLLDKGVTNWIFKQMSLPGRKKNGPLV